MGYSLISVDLGGVVIPADKVEECLAAINAMFIDPDTGKKVSYSWVNAEEFTDLRDAITAWRYDTEKKEDGSIEITYFNGDKMGDEGWFFENIAPFIKSGALATYVGEDGAHWRYVFENGAMIEQTGRVVYD